MRTGNPTLRQGTFTRELAAAGEARMTISGTVNKTFLLLFILSITAVWSWSKFNAAGSFEAVAPWVIGGVIGGLVTALICAFARRACPYVSPFYAAFEGLVLGGISAAMDAKYPGIAIQATVLTAGTLGSLLVAYMTGAIKVTENFRLGVVAATGAIFVFYLASWALRMFGVDMPYLHEGGAIGIGVSVVIVIVAALNLVLDFDFIEAGAAQGAPKYMEWYGAFGLLVTLVWLYIEILRLLAKLRR